MVKGVTCYFIYHSYTNILVPTFLPVELSVLMGDVKCSRCQISHCYEPSFFLSVFTPFYDTLKLHLEFLTMVKFLLMLLNMAYTIVICPQELSCNSFMKFQIFYYSFSLTAFILIKKYLIGKL
jgi:hypothetical protein